MSSAIDYALWIPVLPIVAFPIILFLGNIFKGMDFWRGRWKEGGTIATIVMGTCLGLSLWLIVDYIGAVTGNESVGYVGDWVSFHMVENGNLVSHTLGFGMYLDHVAVMLLFVASFLCFLIAIFSLGYMNTDPVNLDRNHRFYAEFLLFCAGMLGMVLADNFLWLFIFWEIMGLCSYLLIGFYYERPSASYAAKKAFLTTRVGDVFLFIGLLMLWNMFGSLDFNVVWAESNIAAVDPGQLKVALFMMFIGAVGKSAQFPLHVWLPDAMEGPTPVSALIHAATMVNAGLYLVARMFPFFASPAMEGEFTDVAILIAWVGGITACMAALIAFVQMDIKKV
ncbi:MAG: proton-conducting transporter membrane subunit, partial [Candidatus Poseidoniaceae archaeon]|nr:proton-conducting transporter membrane subunit [Candidatus Poseidoniaceae archaeon]